MTTSEWWLASTYADFTVGCLYGVGIGVGYKGGEHCCLLVHCTDGPCTNEHRSNCAAGTVGLRRVLCDQGPMTYLLGGGTLSMAALCAGGMPHGRAHAWSCRVRPGVCSDNLYHVHRWQFATRLSCKWLSGRSAPTLSDRRRDDTFQADSWSVVPRQWVPESITS